MKYSCLFLCLFLLFMGGCSRGPFDLPQLPVKNWLNPKEQNDSPDPELAKLYAPDKVMTFNDLVWLAIAQSPLINKGRINLEIQDINSRDAKWRYVPEMHLIYTISNNITRYNEGKAEAGKDYGQTAYQLSFAGSFNNPVATYFSVKAQDELMRVAIVTQRKAIGELIYKIAGEMLHINMREKNIDVLEKALAEAQKKLNYASVRANFENNIYNPPSNAEDNLEDIELRLQEAKMALALERTNLKQLVGLGFEQALKIDSGSAQKFLDRINIKDLDSQQCWDQSEDKYLLEQQVRLEQANVMLAWAQYMPNISLGINENAPNGQSQPPNGQTDEFLHLTFDLPVLDWGHRWRMAEISGAKKRQAQIDVIQRQREYDQRWHGLEQELALAETRVRRWRNSASNSQKRFEAMEIAYRNGQTNMDAVSDAFLREMEAQIALNESENMEAQTRLNFLNFAARFTHYFLGNAGYVKAD